MTAIATTLVIPAIDLREGAVVRLRQGDYDQQTTFAVDPVSLARRYRQAGASWLHVVDLDGARSGRFTNLALIAALSGEGLRLQAGGGIRDVEGVQALFDAGVERVVIGSVAVREPEKVAGWIQRFGAARLTLALDTRLRDGQWQLPHAGWTRTDGATLAELAPFYEAAGAVHLLCTDIDRDGMMSGPNLALYEHLATLAPRLALQVSGGVRSTDDVKAAARIGAAGVILGRALLEGALTLEDARAALSVRAREAASC